MIGDDDASQREFVGFIWIDDHPGIRLRIAAVTAEDARAQVVAQYGDGHSISLWNEADAQRRR